MKMRYIRQQKKTTDADKRFRLANANPNNQNPMEYEFPEMEEYFPR
jgi:hypothetical protein